MLQSEKKTRRREMLAAVIQEELSGIILDAVKDPACEGTVITGVKVNVDLSQAIVSIRSRHGAEDTTEKALAALNHAASFIKSKLRGRLDIRKIPDIKFVEDVGLLENVRMANLLDSMKQAGTLEISTEKDEGGEPEAPAK